MRTEVKPGCFLLTGKYCSVATGFCKMQRWRILRIHQNLMYGCSLQNTTPKRFIPQFNKGPRKGPEVVSFKIHYRSIMSREKLSDFARREGLKLKLAIKLQYIRALSRFFW